MTSPPRGRRARRLVALALLGAGVAPSSAAMARTGSTPNGIKLTAPVQVKRNTVYDVTISGFSRHRAHAYLFIDYQGCARSFSVEQDRAGSESERYSVKGRFARTTGWKSTQAGDDHACAYLVGGRSSTLLASAKRAYPVG